MIIHKLFLLCGAVLIAGCATSEKYEAKLASWVGSPERDLIRSWGPPQQVYESGDGTKYLTYSSSRDIFIPGTAPTYTTTYNQHNQNNQNNPYNIYNNSATTTSSGGTAAKNINMACQTTFEISNGNVSSWTWKGNDCKSK